MATYGVDFLGSSYYGATSYVDFDASPFVVEPFGYGGLRLLWVPPSGAWDLLRIVRNSYGAPDWEDDGTVVAEETGPNTAEFFDQSLSGGRFYYYAIFVRETATQQWHRAATASGLTIRDFDQGGTFFRWLPGWFQEQDEMLGTVRAGLPEPGPLKKFLDVTGLAASLVRTEYNSLRWTRNPDKISGNLLPPLAQQFGVPVEPAIGMRRTRFWTRDAVFLYRRKGTLPGIQGITTTVTGWDSRVSYGWNLLRGIDAEAWFVSSGAIANDLPNSDLDAGDVRTLLTSPPWAIASAPAGAQMKFFGRPVGDSTYHFARGDFRASVAAATVNVTVTLRWYDANGTLLAGEVSTTSAVTDTAWKTINVEGAPPVGAAYVAVAFSGDGAVAFRHALLGTGTPRLGWTPPMSLDIFVLPVRSNFVTNPSFELSLLTWSITNGFMERDETLGSYTGVAALHVTTASAGAIVSGGPYQIDNDLVRHTATIRSKTNTIRIRSRWVDANRVVLDTTPWRAVTEPADANGWYLAAASSFPPEGAVGGIIDVEVSAGDVLDAAMLEASDAPGDYFDGSWPGGDYLWNGDAHTSASRYYPARAVRSTRLRELLPDWLPIGQHYTIRYITDPVHFVGATDTGTLGIGTLGTMGLGE